MEEITIINIINCCCDVLSLILSVFAASSVIKIKKGNIKNKMFNFGKGNNQQNNVNISQAENFGNTINITGKKVPELTESEYNFNLNKDENVVLYFNQIEKTVLKSFVKLNSLYLDIDFRNKYPNPTETPFAGCAIKSIPMSDWRGFINENYILSFDCISNFECEMQFEITSSVGKIFQQPIIFKKDISNKFTINLANFKSAVENWETVTEICFVFFPEKCLNTFGTICINNLCIKKAP